MNGHDWHKGIEEIEALVARIADITGDTLALDDYTLACAFVDRTEAELERMEPNEATAAALRLIDVAEALGRYDEIKAQISAVLNSYPASVGGKVWVNITRNGDRTVLIAVRDEGTGLPDEFNPRKSRGLGMRIVQAFATQLNTTLEFHNRSPGTEVTLLFPLDHL